MIPARGRARSRKINYISKVKIEFRWRGAFVFAQRRPSSRPVPQSLPVPRNGRNFKRKFTNEGDFPCAPPSVPPSRQEQREEEKEEEEGEEEEEEKEEGAKRKIARRFSDFRASSSTDGPPPAAARLSPEEFRVLFSSQFAAAN